MDTPSIASPPPLLISLEQLKSEFGGVQACLAAHAECSDLLITWAVQMEVGGEGVSDFSPQKFFVTVAVIWSELDPEQGFDLCVQHCPTNHHMLYAYIPAHSYGKADFGIFIAENAHGEHLVNGLVGELLTQAKIEEALREPRSS